MTPVPLKIKPLVDYMRKHGLTAEDLIPLPDRVQSAEWERDMANEAIGLVRQHLESVGITAAFVDDAAARAAAEIKRLRGTVA